MVIGGPAASFCNQYYLLCVPDLRLTSRSEQHPQKRPSVRNRMAQQQGDADGPEMDVVFLKLELKRPSCHSSKKETLEEHQDRIKEFVNLLSFR